MTPEARTGNFVLQTENKFVITLGNVSNFSRAYGVKTILANFANDAIGALINTNRIPIAVWGDVPSRVPLETGWGSHLRRNLRYMRIYAGKITPAVRKELLWMGPRDFNLKICSGERPERAGGNGTNLVFVRFLKRREI